jgi:hypothetical protein
METRGSNNTEDTRIQGLLGNYLSYRLPGNADQTDTQHLDDDSLTAFIEGRVSEREAAPMVDHMVDCSFCRHVTSELVRLDLAFADEPTPVIQEAAEPSRIAEVLNGILSKIFGSRDGAAVFAHNEEEPEKDDESEKKEDTSEK